MGPVQFLYSMCNIFLNFFTQFPNQGIHPLQFGSIFNLFKPSACWLKTNFSNCLDMFINRLIHGSKLIFQQRWTANGWIVVSLIHQLSQVIICINYYILLWLKLLVDKNALCFHTSLCGFHIRVNFSPKIQPGSTCTYLFKTLLD